jgi:hypothetical protein
VSIKLEPHDIVLCREKSGFWGKFGCFLGLHDWNTSGFVNPLNPVQFERCGRCGVGRQFQIAGNIAYYDKKEADEIMKKINLSENRHRS